MDTTIPPPNAEVIKLENVYQKNLVSGSKGLANLSLTETSRSHPLRPGYGTRGRSVVLWANYFELMPPPNLVLYRYSVDVLPTAPGKKLRQIVRLLIQDPQYLGLRNDIVTDFKSNLISPKPLEIGEFTIKYQAEDEDEPRADAPNYQVRVGETGILTVSELTDFLASATVDASCTNELPILQALNILLGHYAKSSSFLSTIGSNKAFPLSGNAQKWNLGAGLEAIKGFFSSVRGAANRLLINVNVAHAAFYVPTLLPETIWSFERQSTNILRLEAFLRRLRIKPTHLKDRGTGHATIRIKSIFGFASTNDGHGRENPPRVRRHGAGAKDVEFFYDSSSPTPKSSSAVPGSATEQPTLKKSGKKTGRSSGQELPDKSSSSSNGKYISVFDYFKSSMFASPPVIHFTDHQIAYNITLKHPNLPVINVGNRENPIYYPAEVCMVKPGQSTGRSNRLDPNQTAEMIKFAVRGPAVNMESIIRDGPPTLGLLPEDNTPLSRFGIAVSTRLITVPGRILPAPEVRYKTKKAFTKAGSWNMSKFLFNNPKTLPPWSYALITDRSGSRWATRDDLHGQMLKFHEALKKTGVLAPPPAMGQRLNLNESLDGVEGVFQGNFKLMLVILPKADTQLYNRIKFLGDVKYGVHTICITAAKLQKNDDQIFGNISLKFNLKLGGTNQLVNNLDKGLIDGDKTMVVGMDVTHPSPGSASNAPSVAAVVASIDKTLSQFPVDLRIQPSRQEMVSDLSDMVKSRLHLWKSLGKHQAFPENILIYRDGVSESQYDDVLEKELPLIRQACAETYPATTTKQGLPRITIVVVGKRHHTRFFPTLEANTCGKASNNLNGTVVDRGVTEPRNWDFFLQAHNADLGTARPAHYYVVLDEIFYERKPQAALGMQSSADVLEELTHSMCYMYGRATKAVSICPPAYYADIACERARRYLSRFFDATTPSGTPAPSVASGGHASEARAEDITIHPYLKDTMFYI